MKLLYCPHCNDIFNLSVARIKTCFCGHVKGQYIDNERAEVNGNGHSLAMGNGSISLALRNVNTVNEDFRSTGDPWRHHATSIICWARAHEGPTNSHTRVNKELK